VNYSTAFNFIIKLEVLFYHQDQIWFIYREDLAKPATTLFHHNLSGILETAIRGTNAQFDDPDILKRLDVRLFEVTKSTISSTLNSI